MTGTVAVVGASLAGLSAARALRAQGFTGRVVLVGDEVHAPYDRPPLSKDFLAGTASRTDLDLEAPDDAALDLDWRLGVSAVGLDPRNRAVQLADGSEVRADGVVLATGARARRLPGTESLAGVHVLRTVDDAVALGAELRPGAHLVVIGAGFIGAEVASTARTLGLEVTVVEGLPVPLAGALGAQLGALCAELHADHGTRLITGTGVARLVGTGRVEAVELADGTRLPADVVLVGIGAQPNTEWLQGSGLELTAGGVLTDQSGATAIPEVVAVGDCAAAWSPATGTHRRVEHWTHALEVPTAAVATLLGATAPPPPLPYFWSDQYGARLQFAGHRHEADEVRIVEGDPADRSFLAVFERAGAAVAVLGMNQPRLFTRWRRQLRTAVPTAP